MNEFFELTTDSSGVAQLILNRPERMNTMGPAFFPALRDAVRGLADGGQAQVLVIASTGKHFSAGMALETFAGEGAMLDTGSPRARLNFQSSLRALMACFSALDEARIPVLCAIQGGCIGGAFDLAAACDCRYVTADAFFCVQETNIGMAADLGVLQRLQHIMPAGLARELAYTGARLPAERALACGLVNAVLPDAEALRAHVLDLARQIAAKSPLAVAGSKLALNHARDHGVAASLQQMSLLQSAIFDTAEMGVAIAAWKARSEPEFASLGEVART